MINIGQKYKIVNYHKLFNGIIVKIVEKLSNDNYYYVEFMNYTINTESLNRYFHEQYLKPLRSEKLKRLLK